MAFTKQGGNIEQALVSGGLSPLAANAVMYAIANCAQPLEHRGPFTINYVPQQVRLTTPERAKYSYQKFDFQTSEGERRPAKFSQPPDEPPLDPDPDPPPPGVDLSEVGNRLDALEGQLKEAFGQLGAAAGLLSQATSAISNLTNRVQELERMLMNTTDCPQEDDA
jgi:hypothetical protein